MTIDIRDYDCAAVHRFKFFFENTHFVNSPNMPIAEIKNNHVLEGVTITFPLVTIRRVSTPIIYRDTNAWATSKTGDRHGNSPGVGGLTVVQTNYELKYMLEVFSFERDNFDALMIELQENTLRHPYLTFDNKTTTGEIDSVIQGVSTNVLLESVEDNTDLESATNQTPFYRGTLNLSVRAYIYRKYRALLIEDVQLSYQIVDKDKLVQQVVE